MKSGKLHPAQPGTSIDRWMDLPELRRYCGSPELCLVADRKVAKLHGLERLDALFVRAGERLKTLATLTRLCGHISRRRASGAERVIALGGGSVGDVVALAAHLVRRGMPLVHVPSTLLAAVDSSIGGKAAVNSPDGVKNAFGAFHFAEECLLVQELWTTLDGPQVRNGTAEALKMVICLNAELCDEWARRKPSARRMVEASRALKSALCERDPFGTRGLRSVLNFGHTVGHALEALSNFRVRHGAAVSAGMRAALEIGARLGVTSDSTAVAANELLDSYGLPDAGFIRQTLRQCEWGAFREKLACDKKGFLRFVLLKGIGEAQVAAVPEEVVCELFNSWTG